MDRDRKKRLGQLALLCLGPLAAGGFILWRRPPCLVLEATGFYCGACGFTRMAQALLQGRVGEAFWQNPYLFCLLPLVALWLAGEAVCALGGRAPLWRRRWMAVLLGAALAAGLVFTLLRNLSGFEGLRPH